MTTVKTAVSLLNKEQSAAYLQVSISTLDRLIRRGVYKPIKVGKGVRFTKEALDNPITEPTKERA